MKKRLFYLALVVLSIQAVYSQPILYGITADDSKIYKINVTTCEICIILDVLPDCPAYGVYDLLVLPNGDILVQTSLGLRRYDPPSNTPVWSNNVVYSGSLLSPNNTVYLTSSDGNGNAQLWTYDPSNNSITLVGNFPTNMIVYEMFYQNGVAYGIGSELINGNWGNSRVFQIDLVNPANTTVVHVFSQYGYNGGITNNGYDTHSLGLSILAQYNVSTNTATTLCNFGPGIKIAALSDLPAGVAAEPCACISDAGTIAPGAYYNCETAPITVPIATNTTLDANDVLRYIVFTNLNDTVGSIILQSPTRVIAFNPSTMQQGIVYYVAAAVGNLLNNNVDLNDPCLDFSNVVTIAWYPLPSVSFSAANPNVCAGACTTMTATFTCTAPFTLTYTSPATGSMTQTFPGNTGTFQVCTPVGSPPGSLVVQATRVVDARCTCQ